MFVALAVVAVAQAQTVSGRVVDAFDKTPLVGATIVQTGTQNGAATGPDGTFSLTLTEGKREITLSYVGYKTRAIAVAGGNRDLSIALVPSEVLGEGVIVRGLRVDETSAITFDNISAEEIEDLNLGQDVPYLLRLSPSVTTTSDAGAGIGYTGIRIRGSDPARINVTVNGIALNDAESHGVFWVNMPDFSSSISNLQIQRGVGTSTNGPAAFGGSVNITTTNLRPEAFGSINTSVGSFNTRKANIEVGTGLLKNGWAFEGRFSSLDSDGYIERAETDLQSLYLSASRYGERSLLSFNVIAGQERTWQAWYGVWEGFLDTNRRLSIPQFDPDGDPDNRFRYDNETDNYRQDHYQMVYGYKLSDEWNFNSTLNYTHGRGYFEQFREDDAFAAYGLQNLNINGTEITNGDFIRRRWLDNDFYSLTASVDYQSDSPFSLNIGGGYSVYDGDHFGQVVWSEFASNSSIRQEYYRGRGLKRDLNLYVKPTYKINDQLSAFTDFQVRAIDYEITGTDNDLRNVGQDDNLGFFNPKAGFSFQMEPGQVVYASISAASKEPTRGDYVDRNLAAEPQPDPEKLIDYELGYRGEFDGFFLNANVYFMDYTDQLILTGEVNDVGSPIRVNVEDSYRLGLELQGGMEIAPGFNWAGSSTFSRNKVRRFNDIVIDFTNPVPERVVTQFEDTDISFSPSVIASSVFSYKVGDGTVELISQYVSRQFMDNTQNRSRSIDPYFVNDLRFEYDIPAFFPAKGLKANLLVNNVLDHEYENNGYTYSFAFAGETTTRNFFFPQAGRNVLFQLSVDF